MIDYSDLAKRLHDPFWCGVLPTAKEAAEAIELLQRELKCSKEMWEQQQELALEYLDDIEKANDRIAELEARLDWLIFHFDKDPKWKWYGKDVAAAIRKAKTGLKKE